VGTLFCLELYNSLIPYPIPYYIPNCLHYFLLAERFMTVTMTISNYTSQITFCLASLVLVCFYSLHICPAFEKTRSHGTEVAGIVNLFLAISAILRNLCCSFFHHSNGFLSNCNGADFI